MAGTETLDRPVSSRAGRTAELSPAAQQAAARPAPDAGRPRGQARAMWFAVTAAFNCGLVAWSVARGEVGSRAAEWSLVAFLHCGGRAPRWHRPRSVRAGTADPVVLAAPADL